MHERENGNEKGNSTEKRIGTHARVPHTSPFSLYFIRNTTYTYTLDTYLALQINTDVKLPQKTSFINNLRL